MAAAAERSTGGASSPAWAHQSSLWQNEYSQQMAAALKIERHHNPCLCADRDRCRHYCSRSDSARRRHFEQLAEWARKEPSAVKAKQRAEAKLHQVRIPLAYHKDWRTHTILSTY